MPQIVKSDAAQPGRPDRVGEICEIYVRGRGDGALVLVAVATDAQTHSKTELWSREETASDGGWTAWNSHSDWLTVDGPARPITGAALGSDFCGQLHLFVCFAGTDELYELWWIRPPAVGFNTLKPGIPPGW